jgi:hypothetical protein
MTKQLFALGVALTLGLLWDGGRSPLGAAGPDAAALVRQLGDDSFEVREAASAQLLRLGRAAEGALRAGLKDGDSEVRRRCAALLPLARRSDLDVRLDAFLAGGDGQQAPPLPGWARFRELAGDDLPSRRLYVDLYRADRAVLEALAKDPKQVAAQLARRCDQLQSRAGGWGPSDRKPSAGEVAALLLSARCAGAALDVQAFYRLNNVFYRPAVAAAVLASPAAERLLAPVLAARAADPGTSYQVLWLAQNLRLTGFIEKTLKPAARKLVADARAHPGDLNKLYQAANMATMLDLPDVLADLRPVVRDLAEAAARQPNDLGKFYQAMNLAQQLNMQQTIDGTLKPAVMRLLASAAEHPTDVNRIYQALNPAQALGMQGAINDTLKPAVHKLALAETRGPFDFNRFVQAVNLARQLHMQETIETVLRPYARKHVVALLEESDDLAILNKAVVLARDVGLQDLIDNTLKPVATKAAAAALAGPPDLARVNQVYLLAESLGVRDTMVEESVKPALRKALLAAKDQPAGSWPPVGQALQLASTLGMKEGLPLAHKAARAQELNGWARAQALQYIVKVGGKDEIPRLEGLLGDTTVIGSCGINATVVTTQLRDVALAAVVSLSGQSLSDYGFPFFQMVAGADLSTTSPSCAGFADAAARQAAVKKWKASPAARKK